MKRFLLVSLIASLISGPVAAQELSDGIVEKTKALIQLVSESKTGTSGEQANSYLVTGLNQALASGSLDNLSELLGNVILQRANLGEPAMLLAGEINSLILDGHRQATANEIKRLEELFALVGKTVGEAQQPADLDRMIYRIIDEGNPRQGNSRREDPRLAALRQQISSAKSFLENWQDSLSHFQEKNYDGAQSAMRSTLGNNHNFLPRSEILDRLAAIEKLRRKQSGQDSEEEAITFEEIAKNLGDIEGALRLMERWVEQKQRSRRTGTPDMALQSFFSRLGALVTSYERYQAGLPFELSFAMARTASYSSEIPQETMKLLNAVELSVVKLALPRYLGLHDAPKAAAGESLDDYFHRLLRHYTDKGMAVEALRIGSVQDTLRISKTVTPEDLMGLRHHAAARLQMKAGQWRSVVQSLHAALRTGSPLLPAEEIGELLKRIEKEHPEEYQLGTYQPLPAEVRISYVRSDQPFDMQRINTETNLVVPVPGVSPAKEPEPKPAATEDRASPAVPDRP